MGRRRDRVGFGRRQVLQLNDEKREDSPYRGHGGHWPPKSEANALSGLMAHYGESDDSEGEEEEDFTPPSSEAPPPPLPPEDSGSPVQLPPEPEPVPKATQENGHGNEKKHRHISLDIDSKVANFLAEIDALDNDGSNDIDGVPLAETDAKAETLPPSVPLPPENSEAHSETESEEQEEEQEEELVQPVAPVSVWQHCPDENTQYYYYWNTATNEVTWEIPLEYSQHLLQMKDYEEAVIRYEAQKADRENLRAERSSKPKKEQKKRKNNNKDDPVMAKETACQNTENKQEKQPVKSWLLDNIRETYGSTYDTEPQQDESVPPLPVEEAEPEIPDIIGPQLPPGAGKSPPEEREIGPQLPTEESRVVPDDAELDSEAVDPGEVYGPVLPQSNYTSSPVEEELYGPLEADSGLYGPSLPPAEPEVLYGPQLPPSMEWTDVGNKSTASEGAALSSVPDTSTESTLHHTADSDSDGDVDMETTKPELPSSSEESPAMIGPLLPNQDAQQTEEGSKEWGDKDIVGAMDSDPEDDDDFIHKQLEIPVISHYEFVNKKYELEQDESAENDPKKTEPSPTKAVDEPIKDDDDLEFDIDDIDEQLELALEKKKAELKKNAAKEEDGAGKGKRKVSDSASELDETPKKRKIPFKDEVKPTPPKKKMDKEEIKMKAEAADLASLVIDKLDFLEVTRKGLSKLQILLIEIETRISDWREGGLNTKFLLGRLQDAELQLQQYESSAAPTDWACHWDRTYKRYFYCHMTSGVTQWDYPEDELTKEASTPERPVQNGVNSGGSDPVKDTLVSSSQGEGPPGKESDDEAQDAQIDSTTILVENSQVSQSLTMSSSGAGVYPAALPMEAPSSSGSQQGNGNGNPSSSTNNPTSTFAVDPSLYQKLFAPAPPPPTEPPPPGVEPAHSSLGMPRPPPGLSAAPPPPPQSPPPPPPGTTPPLQSGMQEDQDQEVSEIEPSSTNLLAAPPPPPPPLDHVGSTSLHTAQAYHSMATIGQQQTSTIIAAPFITKIGGDPVPVPGPAPPPVHPTTIEAPPVIASSTTGFLGHSGTVLPSSTGVSSRGPQPHSGPSTPSGSPPHLATFDPVLDGMPLTEPAPPPPPPPPSQPPVSQPALKEKKKKKEKKASMGLSLKKKNFPSLVQKWQQVQEEVEREVAKHAKDEDFDSS